MKNYIKVLITTFLVFVSTQTFAQQLIPFQARLTDGAGAVVGPGVYPVTFNIYNTATGGTALWTETHSTVSVVGGVVNVILGSITSFDDPNNTVAFYNTDGNRFIGVTIGAGQEMVPRHQLVPSFHARNADNATEAAHAALADLATEATNALNLGGLPANNYALASDTGDSFVALSASFATLTSQLDSLVAFANAYTVRTGTVMPYAGEDLSLGEDDYYFCDGQWVTYQNADGSPNLENKTLWDVIKFRYGKQDLSGTGGAISFRLPDYRGRFLRGWANGSANDPDRNSRTGFDVNGNAVTGDFVGNKQGYQLQSHNHKIQTANGDNSDPYINTDAWSAANTSKTTESTGGNETRPINTSVRYIIKR